MTFGIGYDVSKEDGDGESLAQVLYIGLHFLLVACGNVLLVPSHLTHLNSRYPSPRPPPCPGIQLFLIIYGFSIFKETAPPKPPVSSSEGKSKSRNSGGGGPSTPLSFDEELSASAKYALQTQLRRSRAVYMWLGLAVFSLFVAYLVLASVYLARMMLGESGVVPPYDEYFRRTRGGWVSVMGLAALMGVGYLASGVLTYRAFMLWEGEVRVIGVPLLANLASFALAVVSLHELRRSSSDRTSNLSITYGCAWITLNVVANVVASGLIAFRLAGPPFHRTSTETELSYAESSGNSAAANSRTGLKTPPLVILVESGLPFSLFGIAAAILYTPDLAVKPASVPIVALWACFTAIAPQLIVFRVATGISPANGSRLVHQGSGAAPEENRVQMAPMKFARRRRFTVDDSISNPTFSSASGHVSHVVT